MTVEETNDNISISLTICHDQDETISKPLSSNPLADALPIPSSSAPPALQLPVFRASLIDDEQNQYDIDEGMNTSDEDQEVF